SDGPTVVQASAMFPMPSAPDMPLIGSKTKTASGAAPAAPVNLDGHHDAAGVSSATDRPTAKSSSSANGSTATKSSPSVPAARPVSTAALDKEELPKWLVDSLGQSGAKSAESKPTSATQPGATGGAGGQP